jgi:hypothetical protein
MDDDVVLTEEWARELVQTFDDESIIGFTGSAAPLWDDPSDSWLPKELDWLISCTDWSECNEVKDIRNVWGFNMAFRREAFERCGLFPTNLGYHRGPMPEDLGFSIMVKTITRKRLVFNPRAKVLHKVHQYRLSLGFIAERAYWIGHSRRMLKRYYPTVDDKPVLSTEHELLKRILTKLLPSTLKSFRKFKVTFAVLLFASLGYLIPGIPLQGLRKFTRI